MLQSLCISNYTTARVLDGANPHIDIVLHDERWERRRYVVQLIISTLTDGMSTSYADNVRPSLAMCFQSCFDIHPYRPSDRTPSDASPVVSGSECCRQDDCTSQIQIQGFCSPTLNKGQISVTIRMARRPEDHQQMFSCRYLRRLSRACFKPTLPRLCLGHA